MNNLPIKKIDQVDRYGNKVSMEWDNSYLKKKKVQDKLGNAFTLEYAIPEVPKMGEQDVPKYDHPGGPKGTDTVPAWLTPGEFVVNKEATDMYEPLIRQMNNHGRQVQDQKALHASSGTMVPWITEDLLDRLRFAETGNLPKNKMVSSAGAVGPYQIMPHNFDGGAGFGTTSISAADAWDPIKSRQFAREYLTGIQRAFPNWSPEEVLRAYNWGPGNMRTWKKGNSNIRMPMETQQYSSKILGPGKSYADASQGEGKSWWSWLNPVGGAYAQTVPPMNDMFVVDGKSPAQTKGSILGPKASSLDGWLYRLFSGEEKPETPTLRPEFDNKDHLNPLKTFQTDTEKIPEWIQDALGKAETGQGVLGKDGEKRKENITEALANNEININQWKELMKAHKNREAAAEQTRKEQNLVKERQWNFEVKKLEENKKGIEEALNNSGLTDKEKKLLNKARDEVNKKIKEGPKLDQSPSKTNPNTPEGQNKKISHLDKLLTDLAAKNKGNEIPPEQKTNIQKEGNKASAPERSRAEQFLKDLLGPLFNKQELKRMAVFYLGGRLMGQEHGPSLSFALKNYVERVDSKEAAALKFVYSKVAQDTYTPASLKLFMENDYDQGLLVPKGAVIKPQTEYLTVYNKFDHNKQKKLERVEIGHGENLYKAWRDTANPNVIISDTAAFWNDWTDDGTYAHGSDDNLKVQADLTKRYKDIIEEQLKFHSANKDFQKYNRVNAAAQAEDIAMWALKQGPLNQGGLDFLELGGVIPKAIELGIRNSVTTGDDFSEIKPFIKALQFEAETNHSDLFKTEKDSTLEKKKDMPDWIDMADFMTVKQNIIGLLRKQKDADGSFPLANADDDVMDQMFNAYVDDTADMWYGEYKARDEDYFRLDDDDRKVWNNSALKSNKKEWALPFVKGRRPVTSGFFEFLRGRYYRNNEGLDIGGKPLL